MAKTAANPNSVARSTKTATGWRTSGERAAIRPAMPGTAPERTFGTDDMAAQPAHKRAQGRHMNPRPPRARRQRQACANGSGAKVRIRQLLRPRVHCESRQAGTICVVEVSLLRRPAPAEPGEAFNRATYDRAIRQRGG